MKPHADVYATIDLLAATWPNCFSGPVSSRRPLKVGIGKETAAAAEGAITPEELNAALQHYVGAKAYQQQLREGAQRLDLHGNPAGAVTAEQAARARRHIERLEARHSARVRAKGLAIEEAARKAKAEAERAERQAESPKRVAAGRKPVLRLPRSAAAFATA
jgi:ProP effector